jgi:predicted ATPase
LGSALIVVHGYSATVAEEIYERARELAQKLGEHAQLFPVTWGLWLINQMRMQVTKGRALANELLVVAERNDDVGQRLEAHHAAWTTLLFVPDLVACRVHTEQGLALYDPDRHVEHKFLYGGHDPGVCALVHRGIAAWLFGFPDEALERLGEALNRARDLGHGPTLLVSLNLGAYVHRFRGEISQAKQRSEEQIRLCAEQRISPQHAAWGRIGRGWAMAASGDLDGGVAEMRGGLQQAEATGVQLRRAYHLALYAEVCIRVGLTEEARRALATALESAERWWEPEEHRLLGELLLSEAAGATRETESCFQHALSVARAQQARSLELRAAASLARLWAERGERQKAHDLLAPVYGCFTEGFDTADLKDAKALLEELR